MTLLEQVQCGTQDRPRRTMLYGIQGVGKAQPLHAKILTPHGFVPMGDIKVGGEVIGSDGRSHQVLGVYPQGAKEVFRVTFRDGSTTRCCADHLWLTRSMRERELNLSGAVRPLRDIRRTLRYGRDFNHAVPRVRPVDFAALGDQLPIDPWLLGMYLGDGGSHGGSVLITNREEDVQQKVASAIDDDDAIVSTDRAVRIKRRIKRNGVPSILKAFLREIGLDGLKSHDKFVPSIYLHAGIGARRALLQGLFDSDGFVTNPGAVEFCTTSPHLAADVCFLVRSLGGSARSVLKARPGYTYRGQKKTGRPAYRLFASFPKDVIPVSSAKHLAKWSEPRWAIHHTIRSVEPLGQMPCQCIRIDAPDSLYVTDDFILTHNSTFAAMAQRPIFVQTEDGLAGINCERFPLAKSFADVIAALGELYTAKHEYRTVVIDSLDWLERLIWAEACRKRSVDSIEEIAYAKGYSFVLTQWREVLEGLDALRNDRNMAVVLIAHCKIERFENPETEGYDRYVPKLHKLASALLREWADEVLFATYRVHTRKAGEQFGQDVHKGIGTGERIIRTTERPAHVAKNRLNLPDEIPLDHRVYAAYVRGEVPASEQANQSNKGD